MATVNRRRLHLLISGVLTCAALIYGVVLLNAEYTKYSHAYVNEAIDAIMTQRTGKTREQLIREQRPACEAAFPMGRDMWSSKEGQDSICSMLATDVLIPDREVNMAFAKKAIAWIALYVSSACIAAWLIGLTITRLLPAGSSHFWNWLTQPDKTTRN